MTPEASVLLSAQLKPTAPLDKTMEVKKRQELGLFHSTTLPGRKKRSRLMGRGGFSAPELRGHDVTPPCLALDTFKGKHDNYSLIKNIDRKTAEAILRQTGFEVPLPAGQEYLSHYVIGSGGFGDFCVGYAEKQKRYVGIKITQGTATVKNEVALYQALSDKGLQHILPIMDQYEGFNAAGEVILYQVMELAGLGSADKLKNALNLIREPQFKEQVLFCLAEGLLQGLSEMHRFHFYHLDVKPNNLVVRQDGRVFLIDFGCSVQRDKALIEMNGLMADGTFFSPERHAGGDWLEASKIDAFAAGLSLLFLAEAQFSKDELEKMGEQLLNELDDLIEDKDGKEREEAIHRFFVEHLKKVPFLQNPKPDSFWSLIANLLELDPQKRLSPIEALQHPWYVKMQLAAHEWRVQVSSYLRELVQAENREKRNVGPQDLPFPHFTSFVERGATQEQIVQGLLKTSCAKRVITICQGMGGVGKTQLVNYVLHLPSVQNHFGIKLWFRNADKSSLLDVQFVNLARELKLIHDKVDVKEVLEKVHAYLAL